MIERGAMCSKAVSIFEFTEYAEFLTRWFEYQKEHHYGFSYRSFSRLANMESPNYLQRIISRQRKLSLKYLPNIIEALKLTEQEAEYLTLLVTIERCRDDKLREELISELIDIRMSQSAGKLTKPMLHYLSHWYYPVIRELIVLYQTIDAKEVSLLCSPAIDAKKCRETIHFLLENDYITDSDGEFIHTSPILTTGDEVVSNIVNHFHRETLILSADDLTNSPADERDISSLVLSLSKDSFLRIKREIQLFRKRLLNISEEEKGADRVYSIGFQLIPRSNVKKVEE